MNEQMGRIVLVHLCWENLTESVHEDGDHNQDHDSNWNKYSKCCQLAGLT